MEIASYTNISKQKESGRSEHTLNTYSCQFRAGRVPTSTATTDGRSGSL